MKKETILVLLLGLALGSLFLTVSLPFFPSVNANLSFNNYTTIITRVNISNSPPFVSNLTIDTLIDLTGNGSVNVTCNATVVDFNNWSDIAQVNFTLFNTNISSNGAGDTNRSHYSQWNCSWATEYNKFERGFTCHAQVNYNAFFSNWLCNITAKDNGQLQDDDQKNATVSDLISFYVPDLLDFGEVPVLNISQNRHLNTTNFGNQPINFTSYAYGRTDNDNLSMVCDFGNISIGNLRFSINTSNVSSPVYFDEMFAVNGSNNTASPLGVIAHPFNETYSNATNTTGWRLRVPIGPGGSPAGLCNGTLVVTAMKAFNSVN